jgi:hypothetical protein
MPKRATHQVLKPFQAGKRMLKSGETVDASSWPNTRQLVSTRYLVPLSEATIPVSPDGTQTDPIER